MYRKSIRRKTITDLNLDSLMDILTCTVGLLLFIVIFAIIEARGVKIMMFTPLVKDAPSGSERKLLLCNEGKIMLFDFAVSMEKLYKDMWELNGEAVTYENLPRFAKYTDDKNIQDDYFTYNVDYVNWSEGNWWDQKKLRAYQIVINEKKDVGGFTASQLEDDPLRFLKIIEKFDNSKIWFSFLIDEQSLEVFRVARKLLKEKGFITGWDPGSYEFPIEIILHDSGGGYNNELKPTDNNEKSQ